MNGTKRRTRWCIALLILNLTLIWGNSLLPGEVSGRISGWIAEFLGKLLGMSRDENEGGHGLLRKVAHFSEFACLGLLLGWNFSLRGKTGSDLISRTLLGGVFTACVDETIQIFVDGRASSLIDVWIDVCGAAAGMGILLIGQQVVKNRKQNTFWRKQ